MGIIGSTLFSDLASGTSLDYMYEVLGISYSMVFSLGDGFEVPPKDIIPVFQETYDSLKKFIDMNTN